MLAIGTITGPSPSSTEFKAAAETASKSFPEGFNKVILVLSKLIVVLSFLFGTLFSFFFKFISFILLLLLAPATPEVGVLFVTVLFFG